MSEYFDICRLSLNKFIECAAKESEYSLFAGHRIATVLECEAKLTNALVDVHLLDETEMHLFCNAVDDIAAGLLLVFSMRMAGFSVEFRQPTFLNAAAVAIALDRDRLDFRDVLTVATLLIDASDRSGGRSTKVIGRAIEYASPRRAELLQGLLDSPVFSRSVKSKGFDAVCCEQRFYYRPSSD